MSDCTADLASWLPLSQLALVLLSEIKQARSSKFSDYLALLPDQVDVPALWSEAELNQLKCGYFIEQVWCAGLSCSRFTLPGTQRVNSCIAACSCAIDACS